jgi:hypothetical protein
MNELEMFHLFTAIKLHFNSKTYDYFRYNKKIKRRKFLSEKDLHVFRLLKKRHSSDFENYCVANIVSNPLLWQTELLTDECEDIYIKWRKTQESLMHVFSSDIKRMIEKYDGLKPIFKIKTTYPIIMHEVAQENITLETAVILDEILNFIEKLNCKFTDDFIWDDFVLRCRKYKSFLVFSKQEVIKILKLKLEGEIYG